MSFWSQTRTKHSITMLKLGKRRGGVKMLKALLMALGAVLAFIGNLGIVTPMCIGVFYSPKKPAVLE